MGRLHSVARVAHVDHEAVFAAFGYGHGGETVGGQAFGSDLCGQPFQKRACGGLIKCPRLRTQLLETFATVVDTEVDQPIKKLGIRHGMLQVRLEKAACAAFQFTEGLRGGHEAAFAGRKDALG
jgi:hypothetical protein